MEPDQGRAVNRLVVHHTTPDQDPEGPTDEEVEEAVHEFETLDGKEPE